MASITGLEWTFDKQAEKYEKMRPGYARELYDDIFNLIHINSNSNVIEIGIGGGQATLPILKTGCNLTAVEYGENLAEVCREKFKNYSNFSVVTGKFEDRSFQESFYDLIFSASAFHWIPEDVGYKKVYSMLKSGGVFARFANHPYRDKGREELHAAMQKIYALYMPNSLLGDEYSNADAKNRAEIAIKYGFTDIDYKLYKRTRHFISDEYIELLGTYSDHIAIEESRRKKFFTDIKGAIDYYGGEITVYDTIDLQLARKP